MRVENSRSVLYQSAGQSSSLLYLRLTSSEMPTFAFMELVVNILVIS